MSIIYNHDRERTFLLWHWLRLGHKAFAFLFAYFLILLALLLGLCYVGQLSGFDPVCVSIWSCRLRLYGNDLLHTLHLKGFSLKWTFLMCLVRFFLKVKTRLHSPHGKTSFTLLLVFLVLSSSASNDSTSSCRTYWEGDKGAKTVK